MMTSDSISTLPYGHYRSMNDSIFPDDTDSNHDDDGYSYNDDNERNMSETISTSQHEGDDIDV